MILHGKDLIVSIDGNAAFAGKSCTLEVNAKSIVKTSPTSGEWEENVPGKKSWSLSTNQLVKKATEEEHTGAGIVSNFYFSNSIEEGWTARGEIKNSSDLSIDSIGITEGIYLLEIIASDNHNIIFNKDGFYNDVSLEEYLNGEKTIGGRTIPNNCMIVIMPIGEFVLNKDVCEALSTTYHVALPCVQFGNSPVYGPKTYDTSPIIIVGGKGLKHGYTQLNSVSNEINFALIDGTNFSFDGIPGAIEMVGKMVSLYMTDENGSHWAGQAEVTSFNVTGTKGNLMAGSFSFKGNSKLQTDKEVYDITPEMPAKRIARIKLNMNESDPNMMITGDIDSDIVKLVLSNFHRYLGKYQESGVMALCQLDDEDSTKFHDGSDATLDGTMGDVYVGCENFYSSLSIYIGFFYKIEDMGNNKYLISLSWTGFYNSKYWSNANLIAAFKAQATTSYNNNVAGEAGGSYYLRSIVADRSSLEDTVSNLNTAKARMNNNYFGFVGKEEHAIISLLYLMKYGNTNSQAMCGSGVNEAMPTGATVNMGMQDSDSFSGSAITNLFGIENWWGGSMELMEGISYANGNITYGDGQTIAVSGEGNPVIQNMLIQENPLLMLPQGAQPANTNYNSHFCDAVNFEDQEGQYAGTNIYRGKGGSADGGISWLKLGADMTSGTRLRFRGRGVFIHNSPSTFEALTAVDPSL